MVQAQDGYLWFGTYDGMARFDGQEFTVFNPRNTPQMPSGGIANAHVDREGRLWASTYKGLVSLKDGAWRRHGHEDGWTSDFVRTFADGADGTLYMTGFDGKVLRWVKGRFEAMPPLPDEKQGALGFCDGAGRYWVVKDAFMGFWDGTGWRAVPVSWEPMRRTEPIGAGKARDGKLWLLRERQLIKVDGDGVVRKVRLDVDVESFWQMYEDIGGDLWICSRWNGLYHVRIPPEPPQSGPDMAHVVQVLRAGGQSFTAATFAAQDDEGNVWLGTASEGAARWRRKAVEMVGEEAGLSHQNIRSVATEASGRLWVGTYGGGLFRGEEAMGGGLRFERVHVGELWLWDVESVWVDRPGDVWVTGRAKGLPIYRMEAGKARLVRGVGEGTASQGPLLGDADGRLWVGGELELISHMDGVWEPHGLKGVRLLVNEPGTGRIWAANARGLYRRHEDVFREFKDASGRSMTNLTSLAPAGDMGWWIGLAETGLALLRPDGVVVDLGETAGTLMQKVAIIHDDGHDGLWLAGDKGLVRVAIPDLRAVIEGRERRVKARLFDSDSGLAWNAHAAFARQSSATRTRDGRLCFPTSKGLAVVDPLSLGINPRPPRLLPGTVRYLDAGGRVQEVRWTNAGTVRISPGARAVRVGFAALHYAAPGRITCATQLRRGGQVAAERLGPDRHADYELLPPGDYDLEVTASNEDGVWTPDGLGLRLAVAPHAWQTPWFKAALFLGMLGMVMSGAGYWVRQARMRARLELAERDRRAAVESAEKAEALRQSEALRLHAEAEAAWRREREAVLRDVHDGIGGLASNLHMTASLALHAPDPEVQKAQIQRLGALAQEAVGEVHGLMDFLAADTPNCDAMADEFLRYGRVVLGPHGIRLHVSVSGAAPEVLATPRLFPQVFRIFKEALANVVKHSHARAVTVHLEARRQGLSMVIEDDGVGMGAASSSGRGLSSMRRRAAGLGGILRIESPGGLRLSVEVPWTVQPASGLQSPLPPETP